MTGRAAALALVLLTSGCGVSYAYRTPIEHPLRGVRTIQFVLEPRVSGGVALPQSAFEALGSALQARLAYEFPGVRIVDAMSDEPVDATIKVWLDVVTVRPSSAPYELVDESLRVDAHLEVRRGADPMALVEGRADGRVIIFHELVDPGLDNTLERVARLLTQMLTDLGVLVTAGS